MIQLHYNWFLFSISFWSITHYLNNFKKNDRIFIILNNLMTIFIIGISLNFKNIAEKYPDFFTFSLNGNSILDIFSIFSIYLNIGFLLLDLIVNRTLTSLFYNLSVLTFLFGYVYGGYFIYLIDIYFYYQFLEFMDNIKIILQLNDKYIIYFHLILRFIFTFSLFFYYLTDDLIIPFYWNLTSSVSMFMIIIFNFCIMFLSLEGLSVI